MRVTTGWQSSNDGSTAMRRVPIERRDLGSDDIAVRVDFCGVCHSDLHRIRGLLSEGAIVPGHEFTGTVTAAGTGVAGFALRDRVAVGTLVDSCGACPMCQAGQENFCYAGPTTTYGASTPGGYSREYVLRDKFAYPLPAGLEAAAAAPLMCAGITMWEPMRAAGVGPGTQVAVAGLGGLGHLGVKLAAALGAEVTVLSRTSGKEADAIKLGAAGLLLSTDDGRMRQSRGRFDLILDTIAAQHDFAPLLQLLGLDGTLSVLGYPLPAQVPITALTQGRKKLTSSGTGGRKHTAELLAFCAERGIAADIELLPSARVEEALARLDRGDVRYRFVLDLSDLD